MLLGQTLDGMRVWDIRRSMQVLRQIESLKKASISIKSQRQMAGIALYASLFEPDIAGLDLWYLPDSLHDGPVFLNVLRYMDIPDALAMVSERTKVLINPEK